MDVWYSRIDVDDQQRDWASQVSTKAVKRYERNIAKARTKDSLKAFAKLTRIVDGEPRFVCDPPLIVPLQRSRRPATRCSTTARRVIRSYRRTLQGDRRHLLERFRFVDAARKVVGVGSVGTRAWVVLFVGRDNEDPLILQMKEAQASVLEPFLGKSQFSNHGQRVVEGQRLMQAASDMMLGWIRTNGIDGVERDFYVRQLWDSKASALVDVMEPRVDGPLRDRSAGRRSPGRTPGPATPWRSRTTSARATPSTGRSRTSPRRTPTRTSVTSTR